MGHEPVEVRRIAHHPDQPRHPGKGVVDGEVVGQRAEEVAAEPASQEDLVNARFGHVHTVLRGRVTALHPHPRFTRVSAG